MPIMPTMQHPWLSRFVMSFALASAVLLSGCGQWFQRSSQPRPDGATPNAAASAHLGQAQEYLDQGLSDAALAAFGLALEENPRLIEAHMGIGNIYLQRNQPALAEKRFDIATRLEPSNFDAQYGLALAKQLLGKVQDAIRVYLTALTINPNSVEVNQNLAGAYLQLGRPESAIPYAKRAIDLDPESAAGWSNLAAANALLDRYDEAIEAYRQAIELGDQQEPIVVGLADAHIKLGNYDRAMVVLESYLLSGPSSSAYERLGYAQFKLRRFEDSLASYQAALAIDENDTAALNGLGASLMTLYIKDSRRDKKLHQDALEAWRKSLRLRADQARIVDLISRYERL